MVICCSFVAPPSVVDMRSVFPGSLELKEFVVDLSLIARALGAAAYPTRKVLLVLKFYAKSVFFSI